MRPNPVLSLFVCLVAALAPGIPGHAAPIVPPSIGAGFVNDANQASPLGTNLAPPTDYTREYPFVNYFKMARPWFSARAVNDFSDSRSLDMDGHGNVRTLQKGQRANSVIFTGAPADPGVANKVFDLFFDGDGDFEFNNVQKADKIAANHYRIRTRPIAGPDTDLMVTISMTRNNPLDPVGNVRLLPLGGICAANPLVKVGSAKACPLGDFKSFKSDSDRIVFNPEFLNQIKKYRSLRFMDWMKTNNSPITDFAARPLVSDQFWSSDDLGWFDCKLCKGVPLEVMIALANLMDMDPWFNIPHRATIKDKTNADTGAVTKSYVKRFAEMLDAQLENDPTRPNQIRRAYVEYSNEVWNFQFQQSSFADKQARANLARFGTNRFGEDDPGSAFVRFYSDRAQKVFALVASTMHGTDRIRRVMSTQAVNPYFTEEILSFGNAANVSDEFAIAPYFGDTIVAGDFNYLQCGDFRAPSASVSRRDAFVAAGVDGVFAWLTGTDGSPDLGYGSLACVQNAMVDQAASAAKFGVPLTSYEGGQHFLAAGGLQFGDPELNDLMTAVNHDPRIKQVYTIYLNRFRKATTKAAISPKGNVFHHFVNSDSWSEFGRWGAKEFPTQSRAAAPKFDALMGYVANKPLVEVP